jgi:dihydroxyacetone kinase
MLDALDSFVVALKNPGAKAQGDVLLGAVDAANRGADATAQMKPRLGRSSYLGDRVIGHTDPGAIAAALWLGAVAEALIAGDAPQRRARVKGV